MSTKTISEIRKRMFEVIDLALQSKNDGFENNACLLFDPNKLKKIMFYRPISK
jgi:hypothetical protein